MVASRDSIPIPQRRTEDRVTRAWPVRWWIWFTAPLVDGQDGLSLTRFLAIYFAIMVVHVVESTHTISPNALWVILAIFATAFGKSTFTFLLTKASIASQTSTTETTTTTIDPAAVITATKITPAKPPLPVAGG
jgi:hypothetical protein